MGGHTARGMLPHPASFERICSHAHTLEQNRSTRLFDGVGCITDSGRCVRVVQQPRHRQRRPCSGRWVHRHRGPGFGRARDGRPDGDRGPGRRHARHRWPDRHGRKCGSERTPRRWTSGRGAGRHRRGRRSRNVGHRRRSGGGRGRNGRGGKRRDSGRQGRRWRRGWSCRRRRGKRPRLFRKHDGVLRRRCPDVSRLPQRTDDAPVFVHDGMYGKC